MEDNLNTDLNNKKSKRYSPLVLAILIILAAFVVAYFFVQKDGGLNTEGPTVPRPGTNEPVVISAPTQLEVLRNIYTTPFPKITGSEDIDLSLIPEELGVFIIDGNKGLSAEKTSYEDNKTGYEISYNFPGSVKNVYDILRRESRNAGWEMGQASRSGKASVIETSNSNYIIRVEGLSTGDDSTNVIIIVSDS